MLANGVMEGCRVLGPVESPRINTRGWRLSSCFATNGGTNGNNFKRGWLDACERKFHSSSTVTTSEKLAG